MSRVIRCDFCGCEIGNADGSPNYIRAGSAGPAHQISEDKWVLGKDWDICLDCWAKMEDSVNDE